MSLGEGDRTSGVRQCAWHADRTAWGRSHTPGDDHFDPFRVGLDHLALAVENPSKLEDMQRDLDAAGVRTNGVEEDPATHRQYISFYDLDDIAWELYAVSPRPTA